MKRWLIVLTISWLSLSSLSLAEPAKIELQGRLLLERADKTEQTYARSGGSPLTISLEAGDRVCVTQGQAKLTYGVRVYTLQPASTACFEVARPVSAWQSFVQACQDIGVCKKEAEAAFAKQAKSRGPGDVPAPALYLTVDYALASLSLPIAGQTVRLLNIKNQEIYRAEAQTGSFEIPTEKLKTAQRLEVRDDAQTVIYSAPVMWVSMESDIGTTPKERALGLFMTQDVRYAPLAYSYLLAAGESELASVVEARIRAEFKGQGR
ncbi:MAG: hypothetical protein HZB27_05815 [Meiothermus silvanus]|nr:hypothetical protein [Allomeiothermus silvanus]